ncbi:glycosyltransferase [Aeromonas caviae]|uniref:glycosyltransferase n=1 Tax=Aeromonas caviae TaxID=648 RepID=UPI0029DA4A05|nr:glycosyltransferase [Aeromonas caviae]MDX7784554.1 glycosyltransferase [Aeromonas caviae]MDY7764043.1 glycosyltransferase [Aeromonas caviae]
MNTLIFAGNIHTGGGVQVATSFISELVTLKQVSKNTIINYDIIVSSVVANELAKLNLDMKMFNSYQVKDYYGLKKSKDHGNMLKQYERCFVIFGPIYYSLNSKEYIVGFAQPWIAYANNDAYRKLSLIQKLKNKVKFLIQDALFRRYHHLVVEHQHVKDALLKKGYTMPISIVSNSYASIFDNPEMWMPIDFPKFDNNNAPVVGFVGRAYPHKNLDILIPVNKILSSRYGFNVNFLFTLNADEMKYLKFDKIDNFYTTGSISLVQCPAFYQKIDALIFPSLLECFSATPLEAMKMQKPILASDYPFVSGICKNAATYFNANNAEDIARSIYELFISPDNIALQVETGNQLIKNIPTAQQRAVAYWQCLNQK